VDTDTPIASLSAEEVNEIFFRNEWNENYFKAQKWIKEKAPVAVEGQAGHTTLFVVCKQLVHHFGLTDKQCLNVLTADYNKRCNPPWDEAELKREFEHKINDARYKSKVTGPTLFTPRESTLETDVLKTANDKGIASDYLAKITGPKATNGADLYVYNDAKGFWEALSTKKLFSPYDASKVLERYSYDLT
jgi:hypothetical protein